jgi:hypothetical protein
MTATRFSYEQSEWRPPDSELEPALPWLENEAGLEILGPAPEGMLQRWAGAKAREQLEGAKR